MLLPINPENPQKRLILQAVNILRKGGVIVYPTDTYYGIGCNIMDKKAIEKIYAIKQRSPSKPFSFICPDLGDIARYAKVSNTAYRSMKRLLPGPYTFILPGTKMVPKIMLTKRKTAGIRVPDHPIAIELTRELGNPILSTSAVNPKDSDNQKFSDPSLIHDSLGKKLDLVIDGGRVPNHPSSVISLLDDEPQVIRYGAGDVQIFE